MKSYLPAALFGAALTAAAFSYGAATAHAASYTYENPGRVAAELSACSVTGVDGLSAVPSGTVYIDLSCPSGND